jgi:hypothetical protein
MTKYLRRSALQFQIRSFRFAVSDSDSDSNMKIDLCLAYKMPNYSVIFYAINLLINFVLLQNITHSTKVF